MNTIDQTAIRDLLALGDEQGMLSFYVGHVPSQAADPQPTAPIELRNQIKSLRGRLEDGDRELAQAIEGRLRRLDGALEQLLDPKQPGRGRALFVGVASGEQHQVSLQLPFQERVVHDDTAYVRPLVAALDEGRAATIVVVSRSGVRVLRWATGDAEVLEEARFEPEGALFRGDASGPSAANPQRAVYARADRDGFDQRVNEHRHRFLKEVLEDIVQRAAADGVDRLVLSSSPKLRDEVRELVRPHEGLRVLVTEQSWESAAPHEIAEQAWPLLRSVHLDREHELVEAVQARAMAGGAGALGLRQVCDALNAGRVEHLLFDDDLVLEGFRSSEGTLHPRIEGQAAQAGLDFERDPLFVEHLIEQAFATKAAVTPLGAEAAAPLEEHERVGALLRW